MGGMSVESSSWIEWRNGDRSERAPLRRGVTRIGGPQADVPFDAGGDELQVWDDPPKVVFVGKGARPELAGRPFEEAYLHPGDRVSWRGREWTFASTSAVAPLEELPAAKSPPAAVAPAVDRAARRLRAGLAADLGLAPSSALRRWQDAVERDAFDPDACADELLAEPFAAPAEKRLLDRAGLLLRDFVMSRTRGSRSAARAARKGGKNVLAAILAQAFVLGLMILIAVLTLLVLRLRWGVSVDGFLDSIRARLSGGS